MGEFDDPQGLIFGFISHSLFASMGLALRFVRDLYTRINQLNEEIKLKNLELQAAAFKDPLTDLHNRRYVNDVLMEQVEIFVQQLTTPEFAMRILDIEKTISLCLNLLKNFPTTRISVKSGLLECSNFILVCGSILISLLQII
jgi:ABC-type microcin C transport system duplicated ATPase subunit YejF